MRDAYFDPLNIEAQLRRAVGEHPKPSESAHRGVIRDDLKRGILGLLQQCFAENPEFRHTVIVNSVDAAETSQPSQKNGRSTIKRSKGAAFAAAKSTGTSGGRTISIEFNETPGIAVDPASVERCDRANRIAAEKNITFGEAMREVNFADDFLAQIISSTTSDDPKVAAALKSAKADIDEREKAFNEALYQRAHGKSLTTMAAIEELRAEGWMRLGQMGWFKPGDPRVELIEKEAFQKTGHTFHPIDRARSQGGNFSDSSAAVTVAERRQAFEKAVEQRAIEKGVTAPAAISELQAEGWYFDPAEGWCAPGQDLSGS